MNFLKTTTKLVSVSCWLSRLSLAGPFCRPKFTLMFRREYNLSKFRNPNSHSCSAGDCEDTYIRVFKSQSECKNHSHFIPPNGNFFYDLTSKTKRVYIKMTKTNCLCTSQNRTKSKTFLIIYESIFQISEIFLNHDHELLKIENFLIWTQLFKHSNQNGVGHFAGNTCIRMLY